MPNSLRVGRTGTTAPSYVMRQGSIPNFNNMTIMAWARAHSTPGGAYNYGSIFEFTTNTASAHYPWLLMRDSGGYDIITDGASDNTVGSWKYEQWYHLALVTQNLMLTFYVMGTMLYSTTAGGPWVNRGELHLGYSLPYAAFQFDGNLSAVKLWGRTLSHSEIVSEMQYAMPVNYAGLNSCYAIPSAQDQMMSRRIVSSNQALTRWSDYSGYDYPLIEKGAVEEDSGPPILFSPKALIHRKFSGLASGFKRPYTPAVIRGY